MNKHWIRICAGVGGAGLCAALWWLSGLDFPTQRGIQLLVFISLIAWTGFLAYGIAVASTL